MRKLFYILIVLLISAGWCAAAELKDPPKLNLGLRSMVGSDIGSNAAAKEPVVISEELVQLAEQGDAEAQIKLGLLYESSSDKDLAKTWLLKAAEQDNADAMYLIGLFYSKDAKQESAEAYEWYAKAADRGQFWAQAAMSKYYIDGVLISRDYTRALYWAMQSHENNSDYNAWLKASVLCGMDEYFMNEEYWERQRQRPWNYLVANVFKEEFDFDTEVLSEDEFLSWVEQKAESGESCRQILLYAMPFGIQLA